MNALAEEVLRLARRRAPAEREQLLEAIADLCARTRGRPLPPRANGFFEGLLLGLVAEAEFDVRRKLAERLAEVDWAPAALVNVLVLDDIEIARPVIAASPVLHDDDLVRILLEATIDHRIAVAQRKSLGPGPIGVILDQDEDLVLAALAGNPDADLAEAAMARLVDAARRYAAVRAPLVRHPRLREDLAARLYAWVGAALQQALLSRFRLDPAKLRPELAAAVSEAADGQAAPRTPAEADRRAMDWRLVSKLQQAGQLRPSYLLKALREQRLGLFEAALATLGGFSEIEVRSALSAEQPDQLALALAAIGVDRGAFPTILGLVRAINDGLPGGGEEGVRRAMGVFGPFTPELAASALRQAAAGEPAQAAR